jgi:hypothetical protein
MERDTADRARFSFVQRLVGYRLSIFRIGPFRKHCVRAAETRLSGPLMT